MQMSDVHERNATGFPIPLPSEDTASEELLVIGEWALEQLPSIDELLELRCCSY